ncbi:uncharacterized protein LOC130720408 [Lotus japonicus]|uniref:uncharacterized protein LOC130720408 n=1 Tax=Lotus japonicus TaxID=34305 RepID=UPI0025883B73|nr:uncharacterized protein LOC130720408 [Lotus japonicus]
MEGNGLGSGMFSTSISSGLLGVENNNNPLQQQNLTNQQNPHHLHHPQMVSYDQQQQLQQPIKHGYSPYSSAKNKQQQSSISDDDELGFPADETSGDPKRKISPWQRMKWTDTMVRLLIMAVYYIGDEAGSEGTDPNGKKKQSGLLQKKGKWKSVSRAMMEKGFYVSPQQCEDKFNDLNKRYKRVNDILGKGTACRVVENQSLLDTMDLSPKMKEEVRKLLNSKHLFFREMCAYHNSCGHGASPGETPQAQAQAQPQQQQQQENQQQQSCFHSSETASLGVSGAEGLRMMKLGSGEEDEDEEEEEDSEESSDDDEDESAEGGSRGTLVDEDENDNGRSSRKRTRKSAGCSVSVSSTPSQLVQQLNTEVSGVLQDGGKSPWEKRQWMRSRIMQLEEQQLSYQTQAFDLEKQRVKWARFSSKKEREMERAKLENEKRRLENERMVLIIHQKELELMNLQHQQQQQQQHSST